MKKRHTYRILLTSLLLLLILPLVAQENKKIQPVVTAVKVKTPIKIDGKLNEEVWKTEGYSEFTQSEPDDGKAPTEKTTLWVAYDENALYVAARMDDSEPDKIIGLLGRRDDFSDSDWFIFSVDPYYDRRSGYQFAVNPRGSIVDWTIFNDENQDDTWDGIWESAARVDDRGWTVEIRIPYNQLRFKKQDKYTWGVNFARYLKRKNEEVWFSWAPKEDSGFVSRFARLEGIEGINPGRRIEVLPYVIGKAAFSPAQEGNPYETGQDWSVNGGIDLKVGLKSNLTLDLTINPDFGQVEVDPAVINLSAVENYYSEKRPFFIEGANIFRFGNGGSNNFMGADWGNPSFFYSRRIGRPPQGAVEATGYVSYPDWTTILTAAKVTGKIGKGWNIGFLSALTEREYAHIDELGALSSQEVEPFSYYGVLRAQKEFNDGRQGLGFITTSVLRNLPVGNLEETLTSSAYSFAIDGWTLLDKNKVWALTGWFGGTQVMGSKTAIANLQRGYPHYFQRPDATHLDFNEEATSLSGWAGRFTLSTQKGNLRFNIALGALSPGFNSSDMGFQYFSGLINGHIMLGYQSFKPWKFIRNWSTLLFTQRNYDFGGNKVGEQRLIFINNIRYMNYWSTYYQVSYNPVKYSKYATRGGPLMLQPENTWMDFGIDSDNRKKLVFELGGYYSTSDSGTRETSARIGFRWKPGSNLSLAVSPSYSFVNETAQWVANKEDPVNTATYGNRYIFAHLKQNTLSCNIHIDWIFNPRLSLQGFIQPFIAVGSYNGFKELAAPKTYAFNIYGNNSSTIGYSDETYTVDPDGPGQALPFSFGNPDFNYKSLRGTIVLRWEYSPGSTLYAVWTQNRADYSNPGDFRFGRDFKDLISAQGDNIFMIKMTYRFKM